MDDERREALSKVVFLRSLGYAVVAADAEQPQVAALASEDFCWRMSRIDWCTRRPHPAHRSHWRAWCAEGLWLRSEKRRIRGVAREIRLPSHNSRRAPATVPLERDP